MSLRLIHTDKFKTTVMCLLLRRPLDRETVTEAAIIPNLLSRGSQKYPTMTKINSELEDMCGAIFETQTVKKAEEQMIQLYMEFLPTDSRQQARALEFMHEVLLNPLAEGGGFKKGYVDGEKTNLKLAIEGRINNKAEYAKLRALEEMCRGERFGIYGDGYIEDVDALTPEGIFNRYRDIVDNAPIDLLIMGKEDAELERMARETFQLGREVKLPVPETGYSPREPRTIAEHHNITQGKICMGYRTGGANTGDEVYKLMLMNEVFGGSVGSRLFQNVREKENLCYYINSFVYRAKAIVFVQSGVDGRNFDRVTELVQQQIGDLAGGNISDTEIFSAKKSLIRRIRAMLDSQASCIDFHMSQHMLNDKCDIHGVMEQIERLDKNDVCEMAAKMRLDTVFRLEAGERNG